MPGRELIANLDEYQKLRDIDGIEYRTWRSGIKHDAVKVMELTQNGSRFINGLGQVADIEEQYVFPLLKSSDIANNRLTPQRYVILTQKNLGDDTTEIKTHAPKTWNYLVKYRDILERRKSSIYQHRPRFSIFGVGDYSFAPWKVTISGLYKRITFSVIGSVSGKPIMVDDTCYFIPCFSADEAVFLSTLLNSERCQKFLQSLIFFDAKRPINRDILKRVDLKKVAEYYQLEDKARQYLSNGQVHLTGQTWLVFDERETY